MMKASNMAVVSQQAMTNTVLSSDSVGQFMAARTVSVRQGLTNAESGLTSKRRRRRLARQGALRQHVRLDLHVARRDAPNQETPAAGQDDYLIAATSLPTPQCGSGINQSRRHPARPVKVMASAGHYVRKETDAGAAAKNPGKGQTRIVRDRALTFPGPRLECGPGAIQ